MWCTYVSSKRIILSFLLQGSTYLLSKNTNYLLIAGTKEVIRRYTSSSGIWKRIYSSNATILGQQFLFLLSWYVISKILCLTLIFFSVIHSKCIIFRNWWNELSDRLHIRLNEWVTLPTFILRVLWNKIFRKVHDLMS